ncbi:hypothetical protein PV461_35165, partial [Streptomyces scabiei]|nr:hypothetical protein [Streptomyces scabiei]
MDALRSRRPRHPRTPRATGAPTPTIHNTAAPPTCHHTGPNRANAATPRGPPAIPASAPISTPH